MKPQEKKKKKGWLRPAWLNRIHLDQRTKIVCLFVVVMAGILFFLHQYNMRYVRNLEYAGTTVTDREVFAQLQQGTAEIGSAVWLPHFAANEPLYRRGSHYYIGEEHIRIQDGAPLFVNDGTYVNLIGGDGELIDAEWIRQPAMAGMYLSNGQSFNYDGTMADDEPVFFFHMDNGLYVNTKNLYLHGLLQDTEIPVNSFAHIDENGIRYLARQDGELMIYGSFTQVFDATVEIGGQTMSYQDFLIKLGIYKETDIQKQPEPEKPEEDMTLPESQAGENEKESTSDAQLSLEDLQESPEEIKDGEGNQPVIGDLDAYDGNSNDNMADGNVPGGDGADDGNERKEESTQAGGSDRDEIPDRLPDHQRHKNKDTLPDRNENNGNSGSEIDSTGSGSNSGSGNESSSGSGSGSGSESSSGSGSEGNESSSGSGSGSGNESGSGSGSGNESSSGSGSGGNESSSGSGSGGNESSSGSGSGGNESSSGSGSGGNESGGESGSETRPTEPTKPTETLPIATDNNAEKPTHPIATDNNATRPGEGGEGDGSGGNGGAGGDGPPYEIQWEKPKVSLSDLEMDVYSCHGSLEIEDPSYSFSKVVLSMAWEDNLSLTNPDLDTAVQYRKSLTVDGEFQIDNLPPGRKIFVAAYLQYYDKDGKKVKETDPFKTMVVETRPFKEVDHIYLTFSDDISHSTRGQYYEKQAGIYKLRLSAANGYLLDKVYRAEIKMYTKDSDTSVIFKISSSTLKRYTSEAQDYTTALSQGLLEPNKEYRYEIVLWDFFGNSFTASDKVCWGSTERQTGSDYYKASGYDVTGTIYHPRISDERDWKTSLILGSQRFWGYTHTSKTVPKATLRQITIEKPQETLSKAQLSVAIEDEHHALITGPADSGISGTAPDNYKVYFALYSAANGLGEGREIPISVNRNADGTVLVKGDENGSRFCYVEKEALPSGKGITYLVDGLTAGESYMLRVYGSYNLNDNLGNIYDQELGSLRFGTTPLSAYGRMYYTLNASHIKTEQPSVESYDHTKYESATAQKLSIAINTRRTNPILAYYYFDRIHLELREKTSGEPLIRFNFAKENREGLFGLFNRTITITEDDLDQDDSHYYTYKLEGSRLGAADGTKDYSYELLSTKMNDSQVPAVELRIPVTVLPESVSHPDMNDQGKRTYRFNLWEAFLAVDVPPDGNGEEKFSSAEQKTELLLTFGEKSLQSITAYVLASESFASQGAQDDHNVTASSQTYYQKGFTTLAEMPYVTIGGVLQIGRYLYLEDIDFHDVDKCIDQRNVMLRNVNTSRNNLTSTQSFKVDYEAISSGRIAEARFDSLNMGSKYELEIVPVDIRRTLRTTAPRYQNEILKVSPYTAGEGVVGNLFMAGISHPIDGMEEEEDGKTKYHTAAEYSKYEIGNFQYGTVTGDKGGDPVITRGNSAAHVMDPMAVKPGQIYYLNRLHETRGSAVNAVFLDRDRKLIGPIKRVNSDGYLKVPEGAYYMQFSTYGTRTGYQAQVILVYDADDKALTQKLKMVSPQKAVESDGKTVIFEKKDLGDSDTIALVSGEWINNDNSETVSVTYTMDSQPSVTVSCRSGAAFIKFPRETEKVTVRINNNASFKNYNGAVISPDIRVIDSQKIDIFSNYYYNLLIADYRAFVHDNGGKSLGDPNSGAVRVTVKVFDENGNDQGELKEAGLEGQTDSAGYYEVPKSFETKTGYTYRLALEVQWRNKWYPLDQQEFVASDSEYSIATGNQMMKLAAWPFGRFRVIADLGEIDPYTVLNLKAIIGSGGNSPVGSFGGKIDGQGHSMTVALPSSSYSSFLNIGDSGVLENLDLTFNLGNGKEYMLYYYPIGSNYGTIRNTIFNVDFGEGNFRHTETSGVCAHNYGVIEKFALYYNTAKSNNTYMGRGCGGLAYRNSGTIRDGIVYGERAIDITTGVYGGSQDISIGSTGGVVGENYSTGVVEQVLAVLNMRVENQGIPDQKKVLGSYGLLVGSNSGIVRNCFTSGEMYHQYWHRNNDSSLERRISAANANIAWPGCNSSSASAVRNCYYFSSGKYKVSNENVKYLPGRDALKSPQFYGDTINRNSSFVIESQLAGEFYPIVDMPECMDGKQRNIPLNAGMPNSIPTYISSAVVRDEEEMVYLEGEKLSSETVKKIEGIVNPSANPSMSAVLEKFLTYEDDGSAAVNRQFALVDAMISNLNHYKLDNMKVEGITTRILSSEISEGLSRITMFVTPYVENSSGEWNLSSVTDSYTASHKVLSFDYGYTGDSMRTISVTDESMNIDFYYPLSYKTWRNAPRNEKVNYRLTEDICFKTGDGYFERESDMQEALISFRRPGTPAINGIFDGAGHKMDFGEVYGASMPYYFREVGVGGVIKNLDIENLTLSGNAGGYLGLIQTANSKSTLSDIHMRNVTLADADHYAGALVASASENTIVNCTVKDAKITSSSTAVNLAAGGIAGYRSGRCIIKNSFVRGVAINTTEGNSVSGVGGLVGVDYSNSTINYPMITSCYAEGNIRTGFANAGGLLGKGFTRVTSVWSAVDIAGTNHVGSLTGYASILNDIYQVNAYAGAVVSGELYASSENIENRIIGYWQRKPAPADIQTRIRRSYAYEEQLLNSSPSKEPMDATALADSGTMMRPDFWSETVALGRFFHFTGTDKVKSVDQAEVYPILYRDDGTTLLPDQDTDIFYHVPKPAFNVVSSLATDNQINSTDPYGDYTLEITVEIGGKLPQDAGTYLKDRLTADGLDFTNAQYAIVTGETAENTYVKITGLKAVRRLDSYRLIYKYGEDDKTVSTKLVFQDKDGKDMYLFWQIDTAQKWDDKMSTNGYQFENFMVCGVIDLSGRQSTPTLLKLNRLKGREKNTSNYSYRSKNWINAQEFDSIQNLSLLNMRSAWITEISNYMGYLDIRNCSISSTSAAGNFGFIGTINGDVEYVDFYHNSVGAANVNDNQTYDNIGCISNVQGKIHRARVCDISIALAGVGSGYRYNNIGGLVGYVRELQEIGAFGTVYNPDGSNTYQIIMGSDSNSNNSSNVGGIAGRVFELAQDVYGEKLYVQGGNYVGALMGTVLSGLRGNGDVIDKDTLPNLEVVSCRVKGQQYVGGIIGSTISSGSVNHTRAMGVQVTANVTHAGGIVGSIWGVSDAEVYSSTIRSQGNVAGGIAGTARDIKYAKVANQMQVSAEGNYVGGIAGGDYCTVDYCAVHDLTISGDSYVGGIIGRNRNQRYTGTSHYIYHNVVSKTAIEGKNFYVGGVVGETVGSQLYANEVKQDVTVKGYAQCGGLAGYSSGGELYQNIIGGKVSGNNTIGGLAGELLGYGEPPSAGGNMDNRAAKAYSNLIVCQEVIADYQYAAGLIGKYVAGEEPLDGEGKPIKDSGYVPYMSSGDFYSNAILAGNIEATFGRKQYTHYYANYGGWSNNYMTVLNSRNEKPRYDCVISTLFTMNNGETKGLLSLPDLKTDEALLKGDAIIRIGSVTLKSKDFYVNGNDSGGIGLGTARFDYEDLSKGFYPYIQVNNMAKRLMAYQKTGSFQMGNKADWNTYFTGSGINWSETTYSGAGIPIPQTVAAGNLRSVARGMVYPSGPDTINIDFSRIDNSLVNFDIEGEEEYLEKTAIDAVKDKAGVCSMSYDYQTDFVLNLYSLDGSVKETYVYYADNLRRTVMSWNGKNYYILSDGIYQGMEDGTSKKVLDGEFVNLYQGAALDSEGEVHELAPSSVPARVKKKAAEEELDEILSSAEAEEISEELLPSAEAEEVSNELLASDKPEEEPDQLLPFRESERDDEQKEENDAWSGPDSQSE